LLLWAGQAQAVQLWATWELDLNGLAPPTHFVLSATSPTGAPVPPPITIPWAQCTSVPGAQHCAPVGCPPAGIYDFVVHAVDVARGLSLPSNIWRCPIVQQPCGCSELGPGPPPPAAPQPPAPARVAQPPAPTQPPGLVLSQQIPPLVPLGVIPQTA